MKAKVIVNRLSKRKIIPLILMSIVVVSFFVGWWYLNHLRLPKQYYSDTTSETVEEQPLQYVSISVNLYEANSQWIRDYATDLPYYSSVVAYSISNYGTAAASDVQYTIYVDGNVYLQSAISTLYSHAVYSDQISIQVKYDNQRQISLTASCGDSSDTCSFILDATLPRSPPSRSLKKLCITPNDPIVKNTVDSIMRDKFPLYPGWMAIKDWIASNIEYSYDNGDHWKLPRETIQSGYGDCEDYSILMVSMLRAAGWSVNEAYVVIGKPKSGSGGWHAWVRLNVDIIGWQNLEPQYGTLDWLVLSDYFWIEDFEDVYGFNDLNYETL